MSQQRSVSKVSGQEEESKRVVCVRDLLICQLDRQYLRPRKLKHVAPLICCFGKSNPASGKYYWWYVISSMEPDAAV